jgi:hypothetical protein
MVRGQSPGSRPDLRRPGQAPAWDGQDARL